MTEVLLSMVCLRDKRFEKQ